MATPEGHTVQINVRHIPEDLWIEAKVWCMQNKVPLPQFLTRAIRHELDAEKKKK